MEFPTTMKIHNHQSITFQHTATKHQSFPFSNCHVKYPFSLSKFYVTFGAILPPILNPVISGLAINMISRYACPQRCLPDTNPDILKLYSYGLSTRRPVI